jgi:hypothetical protein
VKKKAAAKKVEKVMREFKKGELNIGSHCPISSRYVKEEKEEVMSSGQYRRREGFNPVQIKDGMIVRLNKNGTVRAVLGKYGEYGKKKQA